MPMNEMVSVKYCNKYDSNVLYNLLSTELFESIEVGSFVVVKPNWVLESHKKRLGDWEYVVTHPSVITATIDHILNKLGGCGKISIIDGPMTEASFQKILAHYPVEEWRHKANQQGVVFEVVDLRDHEWRTQFGVTVERTPLPGDPRGKVVVDLLDEDSEFYGHMKSVRGYYGADYDISETNRAHDGHHNLYSVSKTVIEADVFINIPKLKTHRKAGITACLKNLVGINTYKNYLPHHSEGGPSEGGDQFMCDNINAKLEGPIISYVKQHIIKNELVAKLLSPLRVVAMKLFGASDKTIRNGSWYGNDTVWRMILDLNKILFFADPDGTMRPDNKNNKKKYIAVVDAILAGEGDGPLSPDAKPMNLLISGTNPAAVDVVCASLMGFDPLKIPTICNAFKIKRYLFCDFALGEVRAVFDDASYEYMNIPEERIVAFEPQFGWKGHIERDT